MGGADMVTGWLIFLGAGLGGVSRYAVSWWVLQHYARLFPLGTLLVNVSGAFVMGWLAVVLLERYPQNTAYLRAFLLVGLLGGYTTFSAFSLETLRLLEQGAWWPAVSNVLLSVG